MSQGARSAIAVDPAWYVLRRRRRVAAAAVVIDGPSTTGVPPAAALFEPASTVQPSRSHIDFDVIPPVQFARQVQALPPPLRCEPRNPAASR